MKKITILIIISALIAALSGCTRNTGFIPNDKISIVSTVFPQYDWVRQILGDKTDNFELTLLLDGRMDMHSFQPSLNDIAKISSSDLFIYVGGVSDVWVDDVLRRAINPNMIVINLMDILGEAAKIEDIIEGMEVHHHACGYSHACDHDHGFFHNLFSSILSFFKSGRGYNHEHRHEHEFDEHVWLSLRNAVLFNTAIADALSSLDTDNAEVYRDNLSAYIEKLSALDARYQAVVNEAPVRTLLFGDRFPFRYLMDDYGINYYAAFSGCSAETEASFSTIVFLAGKTDDLNLNTVMVTESTDRAIARTIINNTADKSQQILALDSMQSVISSDIRNGVTYLLIMENNLNVLGEALK